MRRIADSTVRRLSLYLSALEAFEAQGMTTVSSAALATRGGTTSAQVRKDLSFFGSFGKRGLGYASAELAARLRDILGLKRAYRLAFVGAGKMASALVNYRGFDQRGFHIQAVYDTDPSVIGQTWNGVTVRNAKQMVGDLKGNPVDIGVIVTPADAAQGVTDQLVQAGVKAILNFAPAPIMAPPDVSVKSVNLTLELEALSYALSNR
ncbi:MAG: redox-sensing transcriptional repressor Rex [Gemmatimonadetes bacterium]|nr:redox-sensing transcriptional repressor Rex [Gemmatimonadota bacterium]